MLETREVRWQPRLRSCFKHLKPQRLAKDTAKTNKNSGSKGAQAHAHLKKTLGRTHTEPCAHAMTTPSRQPHDSRATNKPRQHHHDNTASSGNGNKTLIFYVEGNRKCAKKNNIYAPPIDCACASLCESRTEALEMAQVQLHN